MTTKKYELLRNDTARIMGHTLYRIRALRCFDTAEAGRIEAGEEGGYVEDESNLSHEGTAWVSGNAKVFGNASVTGSALVRDCAHVYGNSVVNANSVVSGHAEVYGEAEISDRAKIRSTALVFGEAFVGGSAHVGYSSHVYGCANIQGNARIFGGYVYGSSKVNGDAQVHIGAEICGTARVGGSAVIRRCGDAKPFISDSDSWMTFNNVGSENGVLTVYLTKTGAIVCTRGCFTGTVDDFLQAVQHEHGTNHTAQEYSLMMQVAVLRLARRPLENVEDETAHAADTDDTEAQ